MVPVALDGGYNKRTFSGGTPLSPGEQLITSVRTISFLYVPSSGINPNQSKPFDSNENQIKEQAREQASSKQREASSKEESFNQSKVIESLALLQEQSEGE